MPSSTSSSSDGLVGSLAGLLGSAKNTLDNGLKTNVSVTFPSSVYFDIFALVVFCTVAVIGVNLASKAIFGGK
jgi:hypothetical protein